jgi:hypothetical protein
MSLKLQEKGANNMTNVPVCQSCEMPMDEPTKFGTEAGGVKSEDYCVHCRKDGAFTYQTTLEAMIEDNIPYLVKPGIAKTEEEARAMLSESLPKLKRWASA